MSVIVTLNGIPYEIPTVGEVGWGQEVTNYLVALGSGGLLTLEGGNFPLLNEVNFGPNYGIASPYFRSGLNPAANAGVLRLTNTETIQWRNDTNTNNLSLYVVGNQLYFNGAPVGGGGSPLTTKGDIYTYSTTNTRQPVGANGTVLVADSSTATGLNWQSIPGVSGSVTGFTFTNANGVAGTVTNPTSTPDLTLSLNDITPTSVTITPPVVEGTALVINNRGQIRGDFSTIFLNRTSFQTNVSNARTILGAAPNGVVSTPNVQEQSTGWIAYGLSDAANSHYLFMGSASNRTNIAAGSNGTATTQSLTVARQSNSSTPVILNGITFNTSGTNNVYGDTTFFNNVSASNLAGTNTGDQTIDLTGDVTGTGTGTFATTLSNTGVSPNSYLAANITVDAKGRITTASNGIAKNIATLVAGTVTIPNTSITATSIVTTTYHGTPVNPGYLFVTYNAGVSFTINSTNGADVSNVAWVLFN